MTQAVMPPSPPAPKPAVVIKTDKFGNLIPISKADYEALEDSIRKDGYFLNEALVMGVELPNEQEMKELNKANSLEEWHEKYSDWWKETTWILKYRIYSATIKNELFLSLTCVLRSLIGKYA